MAKIVKNDCLEFSIIDTSLLDFLLFILALLIHSALFTVVGAGKGSGGAI